MEEFASVIDSIVGMQQPMTKCAKSMKNIEITGDNWEKLVNKVKIAGRYGLSPRPILTFMADGKLPYYKFGYIVRFDPEECDRAMARYRVNPIPAQ